MAMPGSLRPPLRVLLLSDGRPGHYNLSEGIVSALERLRPCAVRRVRVERGRWPGRVLAWALAARLSPARLLAHIYDLDAGTIERPDLIVSAGAETLAANIALARATGAANIFYGSLRQFSPADLTLALSSYAIAGAAPSQVMTLKPAALDPADLPVADPTAGSPRLLGLALGGPAGGYRYTDRDWERILAVADELSRRHGVRWIASNSRRTPPAASDHLVAWAARSGAVELLIDVREPGALRLWPALGATAGILVTADSSSMLSEAVWSRRPVVALEPAGVRDSERETAYRRHLADRGWCLSLPISGLQADGVMVAIAALRPMSENPLDALAELLARRLPASLVG